MLGRPLAGPPLGGDGERLLRGLLGEVDVAEEADQGGEDPPPVALEDLLDQWAVSPVSTSGRTSTAPPSRTAGIRWANASAASRSDSSST